MRISQFNRLAELSPYPVKVCSVFSGTGSFWWGKMGDKQPYQHANYRPYIEISDQITSKPRQIAVLLHEIGHALHYRRRCKCYQERHKDNYLVEYHAERFALRFMLRYKLTSTLRWEINDLECNAHKYSTQWQEIITQLQQDKIWQKCKNYLAQLSK